MTATFSDSTGGSIGSETIQLHRWRASALIPWASLPRTRASRGDARRPGGRRDPSGAGAGHLEAGVGEVVEGGADRHAGHHREHEDGSGAAPDGPRARRVGGPGREHDTGGADRRRRADDRAHVAGVLHGVHDDDGAGGAQLVEGRGAMVDDGDESLGELASAMAASVEGVTRCTAAPAAAARATTGESGEHVNTSGMSAPASRASSTGVGTSTRTAPRSRR